METDDLQRHGDLLYFITRPQYQIGLVNQKDTV